MCTLNSRCSSGQGYSWRTVELGHSDCGHSGQQGEGRKTQPGMYNHSYYTRTAAVKIPEKHHYV